MKGLLKYKCNQVVETTDGIVGQIIGLSNPKVNMMSPRYEYITVYKLKTKSGIVVEVPEYEIRFAWFGVEI